MRQTAWFEGGRHPLVLIFLVALILRLAYVVEVANTPVWDWHRLQITDTDTFLKVAEQIRAGDLLVHFPYHPYQNHSWVEALASEEEWQRWTGPHSFYQAPAYYYFLAGLLTIFSGSLSAVRILQLVLGAAHAMLLGAVGYKLFGRTAGVLTGLLAATYGPFIAVEAMILREGPGLFFATAGLYLVLRALERQRRMTRIGGSSWVLAGVVLGLAAVVKETGVILLAGVVTWSLLGGWSGDRVRLRAAALLVIGALAALSPLVLRNLVVGAPPLAFSAQFPLNFAIANAIDAPAGGVFFSSPPSLPAILQRSEGRTLATIVETLRPYESHPVRFLEKIRAKLEAMWSNVELPDNFSYEYFARHSRILSILPRFAAVWLLSLLGIGLLAIQWRLRPRHPAFLPVVFSDGLSLLGTVLAFHVAAQSLALVMSRYRLVIVPLLMIPAGFALAAGVEWVFTRRWRFLAAWAGGLSVLCFVWWAWPAEARLQIGALRPVDFSAGAASLAKHDDLQGAWAELEEGIQYSRAHAALSPGEAGYAELLLRRDRLVLFARRGRFTEVQQDWEILRQALSPDDPSIVEIRRLLEQQEKVSH